jgi:hypothetical protein
MNHVQPDAGTFALLTLMQESLELIDRMRERLDQPTPHKGQPVLTRLRSMEEYDRADVCSVLLALARGIWDFDSNAETQDYDADTAPPSLTKFVAHLPLGVKAAAAELDQLGSLVAVTEGSTRPRDLAAVLRWGQNMARDLCAVSKAGRRLFISSGDFRSMVERGWVEVFEGTPAWSRAVQEVDGFKLGGLAFEAA